MFFFFPCPFTFIDGDTKIGIATMIGAHGLIHYSEIGKYCHVTMNNILLPRATLEDKVFLGSRAMIGENVKIGYGSAIGANLYVTKNVDQRILYLGRKLQKSLPKDLFYPLTTEEKMKK